MATRPAKARVVTARVIRFIQPPVVKMLVVYERYRASSGYASNARHVRRAGVNLIIIEPAELSGDRVHLSDGRARHLQQVLHVAAGSTVRIGLLDGALGVGTVEQLDGPAVELRCIFDRPPEVPHIDLLLAVPRPKVLRRLWPQLAALGVRRILLTNAERVERHYFDTHVLSPESYRPLLIEGLQQARDTHL